MVGDGDYKKTSESLEVYLELLVLEAVDKEDAILELAIKYVLTNGYSPSLSKDKKRTVYMYNALFSFCHCCVCVWGGSKSCTEFIFRKLCNLKGGPYISKVVRKFQGVSEIYICSGGSMKYLDRGGGGGGLNLS